MPPVRIVIDRRDGGKTVAAVLRVQLKLTWAQAKRLVEKHLVRYGGQVIGDPAHRVRPGKLISINAGAVENPNRKAEPRTRDANPNPKPKALAKPRPAPKYDGAMPTILYSDDTIVIVDKPAGLTTMRHKDEAEEFGAGKRYLPTTLADLLPGLIGMPDRPVFAAHRIDRDTSGIVSFARTGDAARHLMEQFRKHTADRRYVALVRGTPAGGRIASSLVRDRGDGRRGTGTGTGEDAKEAVTFVKVLESFAGHALVECRLETGRTHQVRIHMGEAGAPLCGETVYDRPVNGAPLPDTSGAKRPMLHAGRLSVVHPETGERLTWESAPPKEFAELLARLRG